MVLQCRYAPEYVLDKMEWYEVGAALKYLYYGNMTEWEQTRTIAYVTAQVQSTKKIKPEDVIKFPWDDKDEKSEASTTISKSDIERLNKMAENYINSKSNKKDGRLRSTAKRRGQSNPNDRQGQTITE